MEIIKLIMELFKNDSKTKGYLEKRVTLDDDKFIDAALKARPTNRKLLELKAEFDAEVESGIREDINIHNDENLSDSLDETIIFTDTLSALREIFATDSGTLKRINNASIREGITYQDLLDLASRARPKNAKLINLISRMSGELPIEPVNKEKNIVVKTIDKTKEAINNLTDKTVVVNFRKVLSSNSGSVSSEEDDFDEEDFSLEREKDDEDNIKEDEELAKEVVLNDKVKSIQSDFVKINTSEVLFSIFATDSGTLKRLQNAWKREEIQEADLVEIALKARPKNAKLAQLIKDLAEEAELIEDQEDGEIDIESDESLGNDTPTSLANDNPIPYIRNDHSNLTMFVNGEMKVINSEHPNFKKISEALEAQEWRSIFPMLDVRSAVATLVHKKLLFKQDKLYYKGEEVHGALVDKIIDMAKAGINDITPFMRFMHKLMKNPSKDAQQELYGFLASGKIPINERGNILTYKRIKENWKDCHSGTVDNSVGKTVTMGRQDVDSNKHSTCSNGLHVCSYSYLASFGGGRTVICEVNPRDVVSIPTDYKNAKMRCCKYTVLKEIKNDGPDVLSESPIYFDKK